MLEVENSDDHPLHYHHKQYLNGDQPQIHPCSPVKKYKPTGMPEYHVRFIDHKGSCHLGFQYGVRVQVRNLERCNAMWRGVNLL
jgi:hypothetical protein